MALYQRGRIWYADLYVQGKRVQESTGTACEYNNDGALRAFQSRCKEKSGTSSWEG
jgi:hypothetical protein